MIHKTQGIAIRIAPYSETSCVVNWLTPDHGRIATVLKGAHRPKSPFLGQFDLAYTCEVLFYRRELRGLYVGRECTILKPRPGIRSDWRAAAAASYVCDLLGRAVSDPEPQPRLFDAADTFFDILSTGLTPLSAVLWAEFQVLHALGLAPRLTTCVACHSDLSTRGSLDFSASRGGLICARCTSRPPDATRVPADIRALLRAWHGAASVRAVRNVHATRPQMLAFAALIGTFMRYHLDAALPSRTIAMELLNHDTAHTVPLGGKS